MEPPPNNVTAPPFSREQRRTSEGGIPRTQGTGLVQIERASGSPSIPVSITPAELVSKSRIPPHVHGSLRSRARLSEAGMTAPTINLASVREGSRNIAGVSPKRVMKAPASPSSLSIINALKKDSVSGGGILRTISSRTTEAWESLNTPQFLEKYNALSSCECINVAAVLKAEKFELIKDRFHQACKKYLPKLNGEDRKLIVDLYTRKGVLPRVEFLLKSLQLNSFAEEIVQEESLRNKIMVLIQQTDDTDKLKGYAQHFTSFGYPLEKFLRIIVSEQKENSLNARLLRFGIYLIESADPEMSIHYGDILFSFLNDNDYKNKPALLAELGKELKSILAKKQMTYLAGQLVRELCFKCKDDPVSDPNKLSHTEELISDIAYGYFRFTKLDKLLSILAMSYIGVTADWSKRILMLRLMSELMRITPPQSLETMTQAYLADAIESASLNVNEEIKKEGLELKRVYERFLLECSKGVLEVRNPRLLRMPSKTNIQAEKVAKSPSLFSQDVKWEQLVPLILNGNGTAASMLKIAQDLKNEMLSQLRKITVPELVEKRWEKESVPCFANHAKFCDNLCNFVMGAILNLESVSSRAKMIEFFIELIGIATQINDFATGFIISSALYHTNIERLIKSWKKVSPTSMDKWTAMKKQYDPNYSGVRASIREMKEDASFTVPITVTRYDVAMNSEKFPLMHGTNLNFDALKHLADIIYHFLKSVKSKPEEKRGTDFVQFIQGCKYTGAELSELSIKRESGKNLKDKIGSAITRKPSGA